MKQLTLAILAWALLGCEAPPIVPPPEPSHLAEDIAKLNADFLACMRRENELLREKKAELDVEINKAIEEARTLTLEESKKSQGVRSK